MNHLDGAPTNNAPDKQVTVAVYTPESELSSPGRLLRSMWRDLFAARELAWLLMVRDLSARYRQSALGILWSFLAPVGTTAVFIMLYYQGTLKVGATDIPYPAFVMCGTVFWMAFSASLLMPLAAVNSSAAMLAKVNFPREALILSALGQLLFDLGIKLILLAIVFVVFGITPTWGTLLAPLAILLLMLLGLVIGLLLMPLGVLYGDVNSVLSSVLGLWFFLTPVVYPPPDRWPYSLFINLNPVSPLLVGARDLATRGTLTDPVSFFLVSAATLIGLFVVWVLYRVSMPILVERMHA